MWYDFYMTGSKKATRDYHQNLYSQHELFENGSWLEKNDELLLDIVKKNFANKDGVRILDIGSGVGRNAIPIAQVIAPNNGLVTCIDFLDIAIEKLKTNAKKYGVAGVIEAINQDLEDY
jgi:2-polyprenyl-3-methyl-5-hydroxy-6-metoxy-1,4-benzoquinol methylase